MRKRIWEWIGEGEEEGSKTNTLNANCSGVKGIKRRRAIRGDEKGCTIGGYLFCRHNPCQMH
jgi:hypothetical protein